MVKERRFEALQQEQDFHGDENGDIILGPQRFNIMGAEYFMGEILSTLSDIYGQGAGGILRKTGNTYGHDLLEVLDTDQKPQQVIGDLFGLLAFLGYSDITVEDETTIIVSSSPTAVAYTRTNEEQRKTCYFLSGILEGAVQLIDEDYAIEETHCRADGDDHCRFSLAGTLDN